MDTAEDHLYMETMQEDGGAAVIAERQQVRWAQPPLELGADSLARRVTRISSLAPPRVYLAQAADEPIGDSPNKPVTSLPSTGG